MDDQYRLPVESDQFLYDENSVRIDSIDVSRIEDAFEKVRHKNHAEAFLEKQPELSARKNEKKLALERSRTAAAILSSQYDKLSAGIDALRLCDSTADQYQHITPILRQIDRLFEGYEKNADRQRRRLILKLRSALKLNCLEQVFSEAQIDLLLSVVKCLRKPVVEAKDVETCLGELMDADLSPFPRLEEDGHEALSGHDHSD